MQQYLAVKDENPDSILFFRLGDFYEMFFDDALLASRELEITLTRRDAGLEEKAPMCGVPYHVASSYISKLIDKGYKVAICDQVEDPKLAKGIVKSIDRAAEKNRKQKEKACDRQFYRGGYPACKTNRNTGKKYRI